MSVIGAVDRGMGLGLYARLDSPGPLLGAGAVVEVPTSVFALAMYELMESLGVGKEEYHVVALGSTPIRLSALVAGDCDATMLDAGHALLTERASCTRTAGVTEVCSPYLGTVLSIAGGRHLRSARDLDAALRKTATTIELRRNCRPSLDYGVDSLDGALDASSGLIASAARRP